MSISRLEHASLGYQHVAATFKAQSCRTLQVDVVLTRVEHAAARHVVVCKHCVLCLIEGCLTDCLSVRPSVCLFVHSSVCLLTKVYTKVLMHATGASHSGRVLCEW